MAPLPRATIRRPLGGMITMNDRLKGASFDRGASRQDWGTPLDFLAAATERFGRITWDVASDGRNAVAPGHWTEADDALSRDWSSSDLGSVVWCNPPYARIAPWVERASSCRAICRWTLVLVPASVGSRWFQDHVLGRSLVLFLNPRLTFAGASQPYPKDCMLACYGYGASGVEAWRWK